MAITRHPLFVSGDRPSRVPMDEALAERFRRSLHDMLGHGDRLAALFYDRLFGAHPELRKMFPADLTDQRRKLMSALSTVVANLNAPDAVRAELETLGKTHAQLGVQPEHYPIVVQHLCEAMATLMGDRWSDELLHDWINALQLISMVMIRAGTGVSQRASGIDGGPVHSE